MMLHRPFFRTLALVAAGLLIGYLLFGWLALPWIIQSQAERYIAEKTDHRLTLDRPEFNPLDFSLRVANLRLDGPDGKLLLLFREFHADVSAATFYRRAIVFDHIRLAEPQASVVLRRDGRLNWSALIDALKSKEEQPESALPRIDVRNFVLAGGRIDFADERAGFATRIDPMDVELDDVSTLPDKNGRYQLAARTTFGARISWHGEGGLNPPSVAGGFGVEEFDVSRLAPYLKDLLPTSPPTGVASVATGYRLGYDKGKLSLTLGNMTANVKDVRLESLAGPALTIAGIAAEHGSFDLGRRALRFRSISLNNAGIDVPGVKGAAAKPLQFSSLMVEDVNADLARRNVTIARIAVRGGQLQAMRNAQGRIESIDAITGALSPKPRPAAGTAAKAATEAPASPWRFKADKVELNEFSATLRDESVAPPTEFFVDGIAVAADGVSDDMNASLPVRAAFRVRSGGAFKAVGKVVPAKSSADFELKLDDLVLQPAQPYLASVAKLKLASGRLSIDGRAGYGEDGPIFKGGFALRDLRLDETDTGDRFLIWKSLSSRSVEATSARLDLRELVLDGLDASLIIARDKSVNVADLRRKADPKTAPPPRPAGPDKARTDKKPPDFVANVARLRVTHSELDFADESLALPFGTRIHRLRGTISGLSSRPGAPGILELEGQVDDYGLARAFGQINLFKPADFTDVRVIFRNVEMTRLTPYSATFAGRKINSGKLSLDLRYKFNQRRLEADNQVIMDRLTLGERVESPQAKDLPLDLAIAILQDANGRIELGLPVSGSLDDPQFSYGGILWTAFLNVVTKVVTAPFRALASLFGGSEKFEDIAFEPGRARLTPPEREKLMRLAEALNKRPALVLTIHGVYADADRGALQDRQLRRTVAEKAGVQLEAREDAGPLSTRDPNTRSAIESLFSDRFGGGELASLKEGFRQANPGQLQEGAAGKMISRLSGLFREKRELGANELTQLKGADLHAVLFERLREREPMPDDKLRALATARGDNAAAALKDAGAPTNRLVLGAPEKVDAKGQQIPVKLVLGTASGSADRPAPAN